MVRTAKLSKWGNAQGVRLPIDYCRKLGLSIGDEVAIDIDKGKLIMYGNPLEKYTIDGRLRAAGWNGKRYHIEEMDWGKDVGDEEWQEAKK
jgi:antitoxin MazE